MRRGRFSLTTRDWVEFCLVIIAECSVTWLVLQAPFISLDARKQGLSPFLIAALFCVANVLPRLWVELGIWAGAFRISAVAGLAASTLVTIKVSAFPGYALSDPGWLGEALRSLVIRPNSAGIPVWSLVIVVTAIWWWGVVRDLPDIDTALLLLKAGSVLALFFIIVHAAMSSGLDERSVATAVLVFFAASLAAIASMRQERVRERGVLAEAEMVLAPVALVAAPAILIAGFLSRDVGHVISMTLDPVLWVLAVAFRVLAMAILVIALIVVVPLVWLLSLLPFGGDVSTTRNSQLFGRTTFSEASDRIGTIPDAVRYLAVLAVLATVYGVASQFRLRFRNQAFLPETEGRTDSSNGSLLASARLWLGRLMARDRKPFQDPLAALRGDPQWQWTVTVRDCYSAFLKWSQDIGKPRGRGVTPDEFSEHWDIGAVAEMTAIYDRIRYGSEPATEVEADLMLQAWRRVRSTTDTH